MRGSGASWGIRLGLSALVCCMSVMMSGCVSHEASTPEERYRPEFDELIAKVGPDQPAADVLSDYHLSEAEVRHVQNALVSCVADRGFPGYSVSLRGEGLFSAGLPDDQFEASRRAVDECDALTHSSDLTFLYTEVIQNPEKKDPIQVVIECMVRRGAFDPAYTVDRYKEELDTWLKGPRTVKDGHIIGDPAEAFTYVGDRDEGMAVWGQCNADPTSG